MSCRDSGNVALQLWSYDPSMPSVSFKKWLPAHDHIVPVSSLHLWYISDDTAGFQDTLSRIHRKKLERVHHINGTNTPPPLQLL